MKKKCFYTLTFLMIFAACKSNKNILPQQKMKLVMWDIVNADEWIKIAAIKDSTIVLKKENIALYNKIFALHKITKDEFYSSYNYYENHPNEMKILLDSISAYGIKKRDTLTNHLK